MEHGASTLGQALIATWTLVALAFLALGILVYLALRSHTRRFDLESAIQAFRSLDIEAFRNLVDSAEEAFLRDSLPPRTFRKIKRQRAWAAILYAWEAGGAATTLTRVGQAAQRNSDPQIAASGVQLAENAFRLRLQAVRACFHLLAEILLPDLQSRALPSLVDHYQRVGETLFRLGRSSCGAHGVAHSKGV